MVRVQQRVSQLEKFVGENTESNEISEEERDELYQNELIKHGGVSPEEAFQYQGQELYGMFLDNRDCAEYRIHFLSGRCNDGSCEPKGQFREYCRCIALFVVESYRRNPAWGPCREDILRIAQGDFSKGMDQDEELKNISEKIWAKVRNARI